MKSLLRNNSLSLVMFGLFLVFLGGQTFTGWAVYNQDLSTHGRAIVSLGAYLATGHFMEAVFENWESEFLQMGSYVLLTVYLFQKGSSESKAPDKFDLTKLWPRKRRDAPWPVRRGGWALAVYKNSLSIALFLLFFGSFAMHAVGGSRASCLEDQLHNQPCESVMEYVTGSQFWFESFQNWQSEFLAVASLVVLSIWLRQEGSPESKPVDAPDSQTG